MPISRSDTARCRSRISSSSVFAFLTMDATRLHSISARSSRACIRAVWARHATSASFLASPYRDSVSTSWAAASPAKSATFDGATPSTQQAVSPSASTSSRYSAWALNRDQVARWAGFFSRLNIDLPSEPAVSSRPCARCRPSGPIRPVMPAKIASLTSARMVVAMSSSVEYAGSSSEASMMRSSATLIRSGGWFRTCAASRIAAAASARARRGSRVAPCRLRTRPRCSLIVRSAPWSASVSGARPRQCRT